MRSRRWRLVALIAAKDLRQRSRDRSAVLVVLVAPLGLAIMFSLLIAPATDFRAHYAVVDLDGGNLASALRTDVVGSLEASGGVAVTDLPTEADARASVGAGVDAAFIIPQGFTRAIESGSSTTLTIVGAASDPLSVAVARATAQAFGDRQATVQLAASTVAGLRGRAPRPRGAPASRRCRRRDHAAGRGAGPSRRAFAGSTFGRSSAPRWRSCSCS